MTVHTLIPIIVFAVVQSCTAAGVGHEASIQDQARVSCTRRFANAVRRVVCCPCRTVVARLNARMSEKAREITLQAGKEFVQGLVCHLELRDADVVGQAMLVADTDTLLNVVAAALQQDVIADGCACSEQPGEIASSASGSDGNGEEVAAASVDADDGVKNSKVICGGRRASSRVAAQSRRKSLRRRA